MSIKQIFAIAALAALTAPTFAQAQTGITAEECEERGGTVNREAGLCEGVVPLPGEATVTGAELGGGLSAGAIAGGVAAIALIAAGGSSGGSTTTTTTTTTGS